MYSQKKVAIVCDWLIDFGGAEKVLEYLLEMFPQADIYSSIFFLDTHPLFSQRKVYTSFIQKIPFLAKRHKLCLFLRPNAFERFDLSAYDIVISSSTAESKGVITKPETLHICYCHTPVRYFWSHYHEYLHMLEFGIFNPLAKLIMPKIVHTLRQWDFLAAQRPDFFIANSENTKNRIKKYYNRDAQVISPGVDVEYFQEILAKYQQKKEYYFYAGRTIPYKRFDIVIEAFNKSGKPLIIATHTLNTLQKKLQKLSKANIEWVLSPSQEELAKLYCEAKAFLFPPEEDFGLVPIEAMACGTPVIAYKAGGATETISENITGIFFESQTSNALNKAIEVFETQNFDRDTILKYVQKYSKKQFQQKLSECIEKHLIEIL